LLTSLGRRQDLVVNEIHLRIQVMTNKNYTKPVTTERFIYHVSHQYCRESIETNGLKANSKPHTIGFENAVFAHNYGEIDVEWYPLTMDKYDWNCYYPENEGGRYLDDTDAILRMFEKCYDVWRIDTHKLGRHWFSDEVGEREFEKSLFRPEHLYVVSFGDIPRDCIERARIKVTFATTKFDWGVVSMRRLKLAA
jgi:hypothetical protein